MTRMDKYMACSFIRLFSMTTATFVLLFVSVLVFEKMSGFIRWDAFV